MNKPDTLDVMRLARMQEQSTIFDGAKLTPTLVQLALALGILRPVTGATDSYELDADWFRDPLNASGASLKANGAMIAQLFATLLGEVSASALGLPAKDLGAMGMWYPIPYPGSVQATGFYLVSYAADAAQPDADQVFGIGVLHEWDFAAEGLAEDALADIAVRVWGMLPVLRIGSGGVSMALASKGCPLTMGVQVGAADDGSIVSANGMSFNGVKVSAQLDLQASPAVDLSVVLLQLQLPTDAAPADRNLGQLAQITPQEWLSTVSTLFVSALQRLLKQDDRSSNLLPVLGLSPIVPGSQVRLPMLRWDLLLSQAQAGAPLAGPFVDWFNGLLADQDAISAWMGAFASLLGIAMPAVSGDGGAASPYKVPLLSDEAYGVLALTMVTQVDAAGTRFLLPGLNYSGKGHQLGSAAAQLQVQAQFDLAQFELATGGRAGVSMGLLDLSVGFALTSTVAGKPLFEGKVLGGDYRFGSLAGGVSVLQSSSAPLKVAPAFQLLDVSTPTGQFALIDLTQPGDLLDHAIAELYQLVDAALQSLFGLAGGSSYGKRAAILLGAVAPDAGAGVWPASLAPPFSAAKIAGSFQDPVAALCNYYSEVLHDGSLLAGQPPVYWLLSAAAGLFDSASDTRSGTGGDPAAATSGKGEPEDPWLFPLTGPGLAASLLAYAETLPAAGDARRLTLGLRLAPEVDAGGVTLEIGIDVHALGLEFAAASGAAPQASIFPGVAAHLALPGSLQTPTVAGTAASVEGAAFTAAWSRYQGWGWNLRIGQPAIIVDGRRMPVGQDMVLTDSDALDQLVTKQGKTFGPIVTALCGVAAYRAGKRPGLALDAVLGLLPDLGPLLPPGTAWPTAMPVWTPDGFTDPVGGIRRQLAAVLSKPDTAKAALGVLGWASGDAPQLPAVSGDGTFGAPYAVEASLPGGFALAVWGAGAGADPVLGVGVQRSVDFSAAGIDAHTELLLRFIELPLGTAPTQARSVAGLRLQTLVRPQTPVPLPAISGGARSLMSMRLGIEVALEQGALALRPQVQFAVDGDAGETVYDLMQSQGESSEWQAAFDALLNLGVAHFVSPLLADPAVAKAYRVLELMQLVIPAGDPAVAGVDAAGWRALMSDPLGYFNERGNALFADPGARGEVVAVLEEIAGISLPAVPLPMLQVLYALQLVEGAERGYAPRLYDWVALAAHPAAQLESRFARLVHEPGVAAALSAQLSAQLAPVVLGPVQLSVSEGVLLQASLLADKLPRWGDLLRIGGAISIDLRTNSLEAGLALDCDKLQLGLRSALTVSAANGLAAALKVELEWAGGAQPAPVPLTLYPFDAGVFLKQAVELAPPFALATFFTQVVDAYLLEKYAVARVAMSALGLAYEELGTGTWRTKSPLGLFRDPLGWLLGDAVLGADGKLNITALARVFAMLEEPVHGTGGIGVTPIAGGLRIVGLPYGQQIDFIADAKAGQFTVAPGLAAGAPLDLGHGVKLLELGFGLALGPNFQPGFTGRVALSGPVSSTTTLVLEASFDKVFHLSAGQAESGELFQVLPFPGWQTLVLEAGKQAGQALLRQLTGVLLGQLESGGAAEFVGQLRRAAAALQVAELVEQLIEVTGKGGDSVADAALHWLCARLSEANAAATVGAVADLLQPYAGGITTAKGLLRYQPSKSLPVTLATGVQALGGTRQLGLWVELDLPAVSGVMFAVAPTGVGIPVGADGSLPLPIAPQLHFELAALAPLQDGHGPKLALRYDATRGFVAGIDPAATVTADSSFYRELLPTFFGESDSSAWPAAVGDWLVAILRDLVPRYLSVLVLNQPAVTQWLAAPLFPGKTGPSAAQVLLASQLLVEDGGDKLYMLNSLHSLAALTLEEFLARFLRTLLADEVQVLHIGAKGGIWLGPREEGSDNFGVRVMVPGISLASLANVTFQLGDDDTAWIANAGGDPDLKGGIALYVPISTSAPNFSRLQLHLINIGLDLHGAEGQDLVRLARFSLGTVSPRGLLVLDFSDAAKPVTAFGGGVVLGDIGIALAPNVAAPDAKVNPVAQNLLGSGDQGSPQSANPAANPQFSVRASYVEDLYVELFNDDGSTGEQVWFPVQRSFGPLYADQVGVGWVNERHLLQMLFDGNVSLAGLFIGLDGLSVGVPVLTPLDPGAYQLDLAGIDVRFEGGAVSIEGAFLKEDNPLRYDGMAIVKAAKFGLTALGSYALVPVDPHKPDVTAASLFVFANLNMPLGPHPAFFINGLAAGFGYNRNLRIPEVGEISAFPLVQGALDSSVFGGSSAKPDTALSVLSQVVYPEIGQYWVAGGLQFTSFQLLNTFAVLAVRFGREFAIDLIGISSASFPPQTPPASALAYVELGLLVSFRPSQGMVSARAQLTPNSFVLSKDCHLTGGFAAILWYEGDHAGDFVVTLGGYNPAFKVPGHYPSVPQLGFNWPMDIAVGSLNMNGGVYFALTPSAVMAGGYLRALFRTGPLRAWFAAGVDFLIQWEPFHFMLGADISVGASLETKIAGVKLTLSAQIGALLAMEGPPVHGHVNVDWYVISFSIPFGGSGDGTGSNPLDWDAFQQRFLPALSISPPQAPAMRGAAPARLRRLLASAPQPAPTQAYAVLKAQVEQGLIADYPELGWVVAHPFRLGVGTVIPATTLQFRGSSAAPIGGPAIGIQPMAQPSVTTALTLTLLGWNTKTSAWEPVNLDQRRIAAGRRLDGSPEALWAKQPFDPYGAPQAKTIPGTILGATLEAAEVLLYVPVGPMSLATLGIVMLGPLPLPYAWTPQYQPQAVPAQVGRAQVIAATLMDTVSVAPLRSAILEALRRFGQPALEHVDLVVLQHHVGDIYQSPPSLGSLAMDLAPAALAHASFPRPSTAVDGGAPAPAAGQGAPTAIVGSSRRYRAGDTRRQLGIGDTSLPVLRYRTRSRWVAGPAMLASRTGERLTLHMAPGGTGIVRFGDAAARTVALRGTLPLRLVAFDQYQQPLLQRSADPAREAALELPAATLELVAIAADPADGGVSGWYRDSEWTRLNHYYFQGEGCLVRPEAAPVLQDRQRGRMQAAEVFAANQVRGVSGALAPGWLETLFFDRPGSVAVVCLGAVAPRVQLCWTDDPASPPYAPGAQAEPRQVIDHGALRIYVFDVPAEPAPERQLRQLAVLVHARAARAGADAAAASVQGVFGFGAGAGSLLEGGLAGTMRSDAGTPGELPPASSTLDFA